MGEITREEFNKMNARLFDKMDKQHDTLTESITEIKVEMAELKGKVDGIKMPEVPEQPCVHFTAHIEEHKQIKESWRKPLIVGIVVTLFLFIQEPIKELLARLFK